MPVQARPGPALVVILGASGDLTRRKLAPAFYDLYAGGQLPTSFAVLGVSRTPMSDDAFRDHLADSVRQHARQFDAEQWRSFAQRLHYHAGDSTRSEDFPALKDRMTELAKEHGTGQNVLLYLSLAPQLFEPTILNISRHQLVTEGKSWCSLDRDNRPWQRIILEKPFGHDPASAAHINRVLGRAFEEEVIYRIDHYLGKETVQNLLVFRFANAIFEPVWNRNYIDHVQVTAAETVGVEGRGGYYDSPGGGAMRDMIQSHLLQVMALVAMEPPVSMRADDMRAEKIKVLSAARGPAGSDVPQLAVHGQYGPGQVNGKAVPGYRQEKGVAADSQTDTYAALTVSIDTWRWGGVPFLLRSGKRMPAKLTQILVQFKPTPHCLFAPGRNGCEGLEANQIIINVQPDEGIRLRFEGKVPSTAGGGMRLRPVVMDFDYQKQFGGKPPEAYATLLLDALRGDQTLYKHREEIEHAWRIVQPTLDHWKEHPQRDLPNYAAGTWGPGSADVMLARAGRKWHNPLA